MGESAPVFAETLARLEVALRGPLPGAAAHQLLVPPQVGRQPPSGRPPARIRRAAGLLLLFPIDDRPHVVLTVRADAVRHGGQVSLPGGVLEPGETLEQAALREAHEEIGLALAAVRTLGPLTPVDIPVSGFRLYPIVAAAATRPALRRADAEVARILEVAIDALMSPRALSRKTVTRDGRTFSVPALGVAGEEIWGATGMVLSELLTVLGWRPGAGGGILDP